MKAKTLILLLFSFKVIAQINVMQPNNGGLEITPFGINSQNLSSNVDSFSLSIGYDAYPINSQLLYTTAIGTKVLKNSSGIGQTGVGSLALKNHFWGSSNTALGYAASSGLYTGSNNVSIGHLSMGNIENGESNTIIGAKAAYYYPPNSFAAGNVLIGYGAGGNVATHSQLFIANSNTNNPLIWGDFTNQLVGLHAYVGINTKNPLDRLHIYDDAMIPNSYIRVSNLFSGVTATDGFRIGLSDYLDGIIWNYEDKPIKFGTNNSLRMTLNEVGKLGLGIDTPNADFHIYRNATSSSLLINNSSVGSGILDGIALISAVNGATVINRENTTMSLGSNNSGFLTLHTNKRVGIGLNGLSPNGQLHVHNDNYDTAEIRLTNTPTGVDVNDGLSITLNTAGEAAIQNRENQKISLLSNRVELNGYLKMGTNAPSIKVKKITGTTSSTQGGSVDEIHGLNASKIISITALVQFSGNSYVPPTYNQVANYEFNWYSDDTKIYILLKAGNSGFLLSKPYKVLITYEE